VSRGFKHHGNAEDPNAGRRLATYETPAIQEREAPAAPCAPFREDSAWVGRLLAGDEAAFTEMVGRYHGRLLRLALTFVSARAAAEEVVQDTWLGVLQGLEAFEGRSSLKTWIFRILVNRAKSRGAREARMLNFSSLTDPGPDAEPAVETGRFTEGGMWREPPGPWVDETPQGLLLRAEIRDLIEAEISRLPPQQRVVLTLRDVTGLDSEEVCNVLEISENNQRVLLHRARSKVRQALERHLGRS
jgi:RNA polymerase sigma-70 factor (ECF subfamily)